MVLTAVDEVHPLEALDLTRVDISSRLDAKQRARLGQYFTPMVTARLMASMFSARSTTVRLLDAGSGIGLLIAAFIGEICRRDLRPEHVSVVAFELDPVLVPCLEETLSVCRTLCEKTGIAFEAEVRQEDFIAAAVESLRSDLFSSPLPQFDCAILNPPYRKINSNSRDRQLLRTIGIETSNLYTAFLALVAGLLEPGGELVAITPRSFTNGPYFRSFRRQFLASMALQDVHIFEARDDAFRDDDVLQETIIFRTVKNGSPNQVEITSSTGPASGDETSRLVPYDQIVRPHDPDSFIRLVPDDVGSELAECMEGLPARLEDLGLTVSTGRVVDFRATEYLRDLPGADTAPLIYPNHFGANGYVCWPNPTSRKPNAIACTAETKDLLVPAGTYVLVRRFSAKEERRRVVAAIYDADRVSPLPVGFENHLNYFHINGTGLPMTLAKGLSAFLNSTQLDTYFRQFNGHTQVNATDLRSLRYPSLDELVGLGDQIGDKPLTQSDVDWFVEGVLFGRPTACPTPTKFESA